MHELSGKRIAILATDGFEQSELEVPLKKLGDVGATVDVVSPESGEITGWEKKDWGRPVKVDRSLDDAAASDYDALVLPGGQINPDILRINDKAVKLVKAFWEARKPIGAICHGPWLLVEADIVRGCTVTSWPSLRTDIVNAGGKWVDAEVVIDQGLVTSRKPDDLDAFCEKLSEEIAQGRHQRRAA